MNWTARTTSSVSNAVLIDPRAIRTETMWASGASVRGDAGHVRPVADVVRRHAREDVARDAQITRTSPSRRASMSSFAEHGTAGEGTRVRLDPEPLLELRVFADGWGGEVEHPSDA